MSATVPPIAPWSTSEEIWAEAERLVVSEGWEYARVAEALCVPLSTLQKRAAKGDWQGRRQNAISYQAQVRALKALLLKNAIAAQENATDADSQVKAVTLVHAWKSAEQAFPEHRYERPPLEKEADPMETASDDELHAIIAKVKA